MTYEEFLSIMAHRINPMIGLIRWRDHKGEDYNPDIADAVFRQLFKDFGFAEDAEAGWEEKAIREAKALNKLLEGQE